MSRTGCVTLADLDVVDCRAIPRWTRCGGQVQIGESQIEVVADGSADGPHASRVRLVRRWVIGRKNHAPRGNNRSTAKGFTAIK